MNNIRKYHFCFLAGLFAAGGSFFGKLPSLLKGSYLNKLENNYLNAFGQIYGGFILCQCLPILLMIFSNLLQWRYYLKALQTTEQTLTATVLTAASNYIISFFLGTFIFKEPFSLLSVLGCICILLGLWFLCSDNQKEQTKNA